MDVSLSHTCWYTHTRTHTHTNAAEWTLYMPHKPDKKWQIDCTIWMRVGFDKSLTCTDCLDTKCIEIIKNDYLCVWLFGLSTHTHSMAKQINGNGNEISAMLGIWLIETVTNKSFVGDAIYVFRATSKANSFRVILVDGFGWLDERKRPFCDRRICYDIPVEEPHTFNTIRSWMPKKKMPQVYWMKAYKHTHIYRKRVTDTHTHTSRANKKANKTKRRTQNSRTNLCNIESFVCRKIAYQHSVEYQLVWFKLLEKSRLMSSSLGITTT